MSFWPARTVHLPEHEPEFIDEVVQVRYVAALAILFFTCVPLVRAQDIPAGDMAVSYSFLREGVSNGINANGGTVSGPFTLKPWLGLAGDFSGFHAAPFGGSANTFTYQGGPRFYLRSHSRVTPFAEVLLGGAHVSGNGGSANGFAFGAGGDIGLTKRLALRPQVDYLGIHSSGDTLNSVRASVGIVFRFGK
jgi:hypothetical protein